MRRFKQRFHKWNNWRKMNGNSFVYQVLVLIGVFNSPTFEWFVRFNS